MTRYAVRFHLKGHVDLFLDADSESDAIQKARDDLEEYFVDHPEFTEDDTKRPEAEVWIYPAGNEPPPSRGGA